MFNTSSLVYAIFISISVIFGTTQNIFDGEIQRVLNAALTTIFLILFYLKFVFAKEVLSLNWVLWFVSFCYVMVLLVSIIISFSNGNNTFYFISDFYKFVYPILFFFIFYHASARVKEPLLLLSIIYALICLIYFIFLLFAYGIGLVKVHSGNELVDHFPYLLVFLIFLWHRRKGRTIILIVSLPALYFVVYISQSLTALMSLLSVLVFYLVIKRKILTSLISFFVLMSVVQYGDFESLYTAKKIQSALLALNQEDYVRSLEAFGGSRFPEIASVIEYILTDPIKFLFGSGFGANLEFTYFSEVSRHYTSQVPAGGKHYIHSGLAEVLYRSGFFGLIVLMIFIFLIYSFSKRYIDNVTELHFYKIFILQLLITFVVSVDLETFFFILSLVFAVLLASINNKPKAMEIDR